MSERRELIKSILIEPVRYVRDFLISPVTYARQLRENGCITGNGSARDASIGVLSISIILLAPPLFLTGILTQDSEVLRLSSVMTIIDAAVVTSAILASRNTHNSHTLRPAQDDS